MIAVGTEQGEVRISRSVISRIVIQTVFETFQGKVLICNSKGKKVRIGGTGRERLNFIEVAQNDDDTVSIHFYAVLRFGTSRNSIETVLSSAIRNNVNELTSLEISDMVMTVTGILSKNSVVKRVFDIVL